MNRILLVDGMNMFIRSFAALGLANDNGNHIGGIYGVMQSIKSIAEAFHPTRIIWCWEGKNAGKKRKEILGAYKEGRKVKRSLNRTFQWEYPDQEWESFRAQLYRVKEYLEALPIYQVEVENMEADDVIGYVCNYVWPDDEKIIISSDKDYFQLVTDKVSVYRPVKKELIDYQHMIDNYKIHPANWIIIKVLTGDGSDGVPGIAKGLGIKTINKLFPFLLEPRRVPISEIVDHCQKNINGKSKFYKIVYENQDILKRNWDLMQLLEHQFSVDGVQKVKDALNQKPLMKSFQLRLLFLQDNAYKQIQNMDYWNRIFVPLNFRET